MDNDLGVAWSYISADRLADFPIGRVVSGLVVTAELASMAVHPVPDKTAFTHNIIGGAYE